MTKVNRKPSLITEMELAMNVHGEVHAVVDGEDREVELRADPTTFDYDCDVVRVKGPNTTHVFGFDRFISFYKPMSVFHE